MVSLLGAIIFWGGTILFEESSAENYYTIFKHQSVSEDFMLEPVKSGGKLMAKKLVNDLSTPNPFKKFAIRGLGVLQDESSIPLLNQLLNNAQETDLYRGEAYLALVTMNTEESTRYASLFLEVADPVLDKEVIKYIKMRAPDRVN